PACASPRGARRTARWAAPRRSRCRRSTTRSRASWPPGDERFMAGGPASPPAHASGRKSLAPASPTAGCKENDMPQQRNDKQKNQNQDQQKQGQGQQKQQGQDQQKQQRQKDR